MSKLFEQVKDLEAVRKPYLAPKIIIVDGQPGCGKTLLSQIIAGLDRVELLTYAYEIEHACSLWSLGKIKDDAAVTLVRLISDLKLYNLTMGRETNFRWNDLSSAVQSPRPLSYLSRLFGKGDESVPAMVKQRNPILHLTTHNLLMIAEPVFAALEDRLVFINMVRHPLYMIKQISLNWEKLHHDVRNFTVHYQYQGQDLPYYIAGWEDLFLKSNAVERTIYAMDNWTKKRQQAMGSFSPQASSSIITVPFETFVISPDPFMDQMANALGSAVTPLTKRIMKQQKVPRKMYAQGIDLKVYKRYGWQPPQSADENKEFELRWQWARQSASPQAMDVLGKLCRDYEATYLGGAKEYQATV